MGSLEGRQTDRQLIRKFCLKILQSWLNLCFPILHTSLLSNSADLPTSLLATAWRLGKCCNFTVTFTVLCLIAPEHQGFIFFKLVVALTKGSPTSMTAASYSCKYSALHLPESNWSSLLQ